jgi:hypothetical protein
VPSPDLVVALLSTPLPRGERAHLRRRARLTHQRPRSEAFSRHNRARVLLTTTTLSRARQKREAKRRKAHVPTMSAHAQTSVRSLRQLICKRGCAPLSEARPPSGASPRHSPPATTPMAQPQNRVSSRRGAPGVLPVRRTRLELSTLRADRSFCRSTGAPGPPGSGSHSSARGHRSLLRLPKVPSRKAPSSKQVMRQVTILATAVKPKSRSR